MQLKENERLDEVNDRLSLIQNTEGLTFGTDALLLAAYIGRGYRSGIELGGGTGIISMLLATREKIERISCVEIQEEYAELISRNIEYNSLSDKIECINGDVRDLALTEAEVVFSNPPYMKSTSGYSNKVGKKNIARHEIHGTIEDFLLSAKRMLKFGGDFFAVYRPDRLADIISAMRDAGIEPKRLTMVHADEESAPSMMLIEGRRGGRSGMRVTKPLLLYPVGRRDTYTADMTYIMENGEFPREFSVN